MGLKRALRATSQTDHLGADAGCPSRERCMESPQVRPADVHVAPIGVVSAWFDSTPARKTHPSLRLLSK